MMRNGIKPHLLLDSYSASFHVFHIFLAIYYGIEHI